MLYFYLRRAFRSLRRNPVLSSVMVVDMALGIAIWVMSYAAVRSHTRDPLPDSSAIFHVDWGTAPDAELSVEGYARSLSMAPHVLLSYRDARRLEDHEAVARSAKTFTSRIAVGTPHGREETAVRFCTRALFGMFELAFEHGGAWSAAEEQALAPVIVLDHASNQALFGGRNSVGRTLDIDGQAYRVVGVLAEMGERVRGFDFSFTSPPALYLPFEQFVTLGVRPDYYAHRAQGGLAVSDLATSDDVFVQLWVELPDAARRARYTAFLNDAAKARGAGLGMGAQKRAQLEPLPRWLEQNVPIPNGFYMFHACAFLALLACSVNLSRLLIVKFQARAQELAVQRALGATRMAVFGQHMLEVVLVTLAATLLSLVIAWASLIGINTIVPDRPSEFSINAAGLAIGCAVGLGFGLLAGIPAAYRMCRAAPAAFLRLQ